MDERLAAHLELAALSEEDFVERAFRLLLRRPPDDEARVHALAALSEHGLSRGGLLAELADSEEFRRLRALDDGIGRGAAARSTSVRSSSPGHSAGIAAKRTCSTSATPWPSQPGSPRCSGSARRSSSGSTSPSATSPG